MEVLDPARGSRQWAEAVEQYRTATRFEGDPNLPSEPATPQGYAQLVRQHLTFMARQGNVAEIFWADAFVAEGDRENTMLWLHKAAANHDSGFSFEIRNPIFDLVRQDPRYFTMTQSLGLPQ